MKHITTIITIILLTAISFLTLDGNGQSPKNSLNETIESTMDRLRTLHKKYGAAKMILKDRSIYKRVTIHQINSFWLVFIKDGSLHDMLIEKISKIQFGKDEGAIVTFNKDNQISISY